MPLSSRIRFLVIGVFWTYFVAFSSQSVLAQPTSRIEVTPAVTLDFRDVATETSVTATIRVANRGVGTLLAAVALGPGSSPDFTLSGFSVPISLTSNQVAQINVRYRTDEPGPDTGTVVIESNDPARPVVTVNLLARGVVLSPQIRVVPLTLDFGARPIGSLNGRAFAIHNDGNGALRIARIALSAGTSGEFELAAGTVPPTIAAGASASGAVIYRPADLVRDGGLLMIETNDAVTPVFRLVLSGSGLPILEPRIGVSPTALDFSAVSVGASSSIALTITNVGINVLEVTDISFAAGTSPSFAIASAPASALLRASESATVEVSYSPSAEGTDGGVLQIASNDAQAPQVSVALSGTGVPSLFRRGDSNADGMVGIDDALSTLDHLFNRAAMPPACQDASDANDDQFVDLSDVIFTLMWTFGIGDVPAPGAEACGADPTADELPHCAYPQELCGAL